LAVGTRPTSSGACGIPVTADRLVLDTSVLVKWFKTEGEELLNEAHALLMRIMDRHLEVHVPALLYYEIGNVLLQKSELEAGEVDRALHDVERLPLIAVPPVSTLLLGAGRMGREFRLTFYDASFVVLAAQLECRFVTADRLLAERTRSLGWVHHLSRIESITL
jgi:predicted nucleic acid-binding protein